jgi:hypothetical protein
MWIKTLLLLPFWLFSGCLLADTGSTEKPDSPPPAKIQPGTPITSEDGSSSLFSLLDGPQQYISSSFLGFSKSVDEFFSDEKAEYESNGSYIRLTGDSVFTDGEGWGFNGSTRAKLVLPNTQRKLRLVFESDPEQERESPQQQLNSNPIDAAEKKAYFAGIEGLLGEFEYWRFRPGIGLKLNRKLDFFVRFRASRKFDISERWQGYLGNTLYWFNSTGFRFDTRLEFDRRFGEQKLFRFVTSARREQDNDWWDLAQIFSITHTIDRRQAIIYLAGVYGINEPNTHAESYQLQMRYRRLLHRDYLFGELIPQLQYLQEDEFEPVFSFTLRLEMVFKG